MARWIYRYHEICRIALCRLRVYGYRLSGGRGIDPKCLIGRGVRIERPWLVRLGARCVLQPDVWLNVGSDTARLEIGDFTFIGRGVEIEVSSRVTIGRGGLIAPGVFITDHNHGTALGRPMFEQPCIAAPITIGTDVWIGAGAIILPGAEIGDGAIIGAGAVVTGCIRQNSIAAGVPARCIGTRAVSQGSAISGNKTTSDD